jgi:CCR4-NOT transcription complex subunit 9
MLQTQAQHIFSHQHQYPQADPSWLQHQHQQHQAQQHPHQAQQQHLAQQHAQVQAAAAAAAAAQQQHYNRIAMAGTGGNPAQPGAGAMNGDGAMHGSASVMDGAVSEENRKVFIWVAELLDPNRRETALMELSKKREQVPELALVIWHSFGTSDPLGLYCGSWLMCGSLARSQASWLPCSRRLSRSIRC